MALLWILAIFLDICLCFIYNSSKSLIQGKLGFIIKYSKCVFEKDQFLALLLYAKMYCYEFSQFSKMLNFLQMASIGFWLSIKFWWKKKLKKSTLLHLKKHSITRMIRCMKKVNLKKMEKPWFHKVWYILYILRNDILIDESLSYELLLLQLTFTYRRITVWDHFFDKQLGVS